MVLVVPTSDWLAPCQPKHEIDFLDIRHVSLLHACLDVSLIRPHRSISRHARWLDRYPLGFEN